MSLSSPSQVSATIGSDQQYSELGCRFSLRHQAIRITSYNVCYTKLLRSGVELRSGVGDRARSEGREECGNRRDRARARVGVDPHCGGTFLGTPGQTLLGTRASGPAAACSVRRRAINPVHHAAYAQIERLGKRKLSARARCATRSPHPRCPEGWIGAFRDPARDFAELEVVVDSYNFV